MAVQRPIKTSGTRTFVEERIAGFPIIEAAEVDAEFDNLVTAVNTGNIVLPPLLDLSVGTDTLANNAVTTPKLADGAVTDPKIVSVSWLKVTGTPTSFPASGTAGGDLIGSFPNPTIRNEAVTAAAIEDGAVTFPKLASNSVGVLALINGAVDRVKLAPNVWPNPIPVAGDVGKVLTVGAGPTLSWAAAAPAVIADGSITDAKIASIAYTKVTGHPTEFVPPNGSVTTIKLADLSVTNPKLADEAVLLRNIDQDSVPLPPVVTHGNLGQILGVIEAGMPNVPTIAWVDPATYLPGGGGGGGAPSGAAGGSLAGFYPNPTLAVNSVGAAQIQPAVISSGHITAGGVNNTNLSASSVSRLKVAADCWLSPVPTGADVGKVLTVAAGPTLAWSTPSGGGGTALWQLDGPSLCLTPVDPQHGIRLPGPTGTIFVAGDNCYLYGDPNSLRCNATTSFDWADFTGVLATLDATGFTFPNTRQLRWETAVPGTYAPVIDGQYGVLNLGAGSGGSVKFLINGQLKGLVDGDGYDSGYAIRIGDNTRTPGAGIIRYTTGAGFEGYHAGSWQNFVGGGAPSGAAGGSLAGTYPNPTIAPLAVDNAAIANNAISGTKLQAGSVQPSKLNPAAVAGDVGKYVTIASTGAFAFVAAPGGGAAEWAVAANVYSPVDTTAWQLGVANPTNGTGTLGAGLQITSYSDTASAFEPVLTMRRAKSSAAPPTVSSTLARIDITPALSTGVYGRAAHMVWTATDNITSGTRGCGFQLGVCPTGSGAASSTLDFGQDGALTITGASFTFNASRIVQNTLANYLDIISNVNGVTGSNFSQAIWALRLDQSTDVFQVRRTGGTAGPNTVPLSLSSTGKLTIGADPTAALDVATKQYVDGKAGGLPTISATAPVAPVAGQLWWRNDPDGVLYIYYNDGNTSQWVPATPASASLWAVSGSALTPVDATKAVSVVGDATGATILAGSTTAKVRLQTSVGAPGNLTLTSNRNWLSGNAQDDASRPSWGMLLPINDTFQVQRSPAGSTTQTALLTLDGAGSLTIPGGTTAAPSLIMGSGTMKGSVFVEANGQISLVANNSYAPWDATKASWHLYMNPTTDTMGIARRGTSQPVGSFINYPLMLSNVGDLTIAGAVATKASGTAWVAASDIRLKRNIHPYTPGLAAVCALHPIAFEYNGRGGTVAGLPGWGFDAALVKAVLPETVTTRRGKLDPDDDCETDIQMLDQSNLILALVNGMQELAARLAAVEARS